MPRGRWSDQDRLNIMARRRRVAEHYLAHKHQTEIAQLEGVNRATVARDLDAIREEWSERYAADIEDREQAKWQLQLRELARIDRLEQTAQDAWERSKQNAETMHVRTETEGDRDAQGRPLPTKTVSEKTTRGQVGDPRFLERVAWCVEQRCRILGLLAPTKVAPTNPAGTQEYRPAELMTDDELAAIAAGGHTGNGTAARRPAGDPG